MILRGRSGLAIANRVLVVVALLTTLMTSLFVTVTSEAASTGAIPEILAHVPGSRTMYVVDLVGCEQVRCLRLFRTNVSAMKFSAVSLPLIASERGEPTGDLRGLDFVTATDGFALVGENYPIALYETTNGARSWQRVSVHTGESITGLAVTPRLIYAVTAHCSASGDTCRDYHVDRSTLSAEHWTITPLPHSVAALVDSGDFNLDISAYKSDVWINEVTHAGSSIFTSHDEGVTYVASSANNLASVNGCGLTALSTTSLWAQCPTGMMESFFHSSNGGATWSNIVQKQFAGTGGGAFDPVSPTLAYLAYGAMRPLVRISDAGAVATNLGRLDCSKVNSSINALFFSDKDHGLALCLPGDSAKSAELLRTSDGGSTWSRAAAD
jgi:photosystem II stability/assembly factor-like uncharacterized protein